MYGCVCVWGGVGVGGGGGVGGGVLVVGGGGGGGRLRKEGAEVRRLDGPVGVA